MKFNFFGKLKDSSQKCHSAHLFKQVIATLASSALCMSAGLTIGITAILLPKLAEDENFHYKDEYGSWIASMSPFASILGSLCASFLTDFLGRRLTQFAVLIPFLIGWVTMAQATNFTIMLVGRFFTGIAYGSVRPVTMTYLSEIIDPKYRSVLILLPSLTLNSSIMWSHLLCYYLFWRTALLVCIVPNIISFVILLFARESPLWLISKGKTAEGIEVFRWHRGSSAAAEQELKSVLEKQMTKSENLSTRDLLKSILSKSFVKPTIAVLFIFTASHFSGYYAFNYYSHDMLQKMFSDKIETFLLIMIIDSIRVAATIAICFLSKIMPRKVTLLSCCFGTCLVLSVLIIYLVIEPNNLLWIPLSCMVFHTITSSVIASLAWTFVGELFPTKLRGFGSGFGGVISFSTLSIGVKILPELISLGQPIMYGCFAIITFICATILCFILPNTEDKSLQDIEDSYCKDKTTTL